ncbi:MAG: hypothetical protein AAB250_07380, partial [Bdellovibrionota bacterium]
MAKRGFILFSFVLCLPAFALALASTSSSRDAEIAADLTYFKTHTREAMQKIPLKRDEAGRVRHTSAFSPEDIATRDFVMHKSSWRGKKTKGSSFSAPGTYDRPEWVLDNPHIRNRTLEGIEAAKLMTGAVDMQPWSGDYWGLYKGTLGKRFADPAYPQSSDWKTNFDYVMAPGRTINEIFKTSDLLQINRLSPSEKYDLVIGQTSGLLT